MARKRARQVEFPCNSCFFLHLIPILLSSSLIQMGGGAEGLSQGRRRVMHLKAPTGLGGSSGSNAGGAAVSCWASEGVSSQEGPSEAVAVTGCCFRGEDMMAGCQGQGPPKVVDL